MEGARCSVFLVPSVGISGVEQCNCLVPSIGGGGIGMVITYGSGQKRDPQKMQSMKIYRIL